jgi:hypothetical protein
VGRCDGAADPPQRPLLRRIACPIGFREVLLPARSDLPSDMDRAVCTTRPSTSMAARAGAEGRPRRCCATPTRRGGGRRRAAPRSGRLLGGPHGHPCRGSPTPWSSRPTPCALGAMELLAPATRRPWWGEITQVGTAPMSIPTTGGSVRANLSGVVDPGCHQRRSSHPAPAAPATLGRPAALDDECRKPPQGTSRGATDGERTRSRKELT